MKRELENYIDRLETETGKVSETDVEKTLEMVLEKGEKPSGKGSVWRKAAWRIACAAACLALLIGAGGAVQENSFHENALLASGNYDDSLLYAAQDYGAVYDVVSRAYTGRVETAASDTAFSEAAGGAGKTGSEMQGKIFSQEELLTRNENAVLSAGEEALDSKEISGEYQGTNAQVEGVDEADVVKTDGAYLYILRDNMLTIISAQGTDSRVISQTPVISGQEQKDSASFAFDFYVNENRLAVIVSKNVWTACSGTVSDAESLQKTCGITENRTSSLLYFYDISDRQKPVLMNTLGQDGYLISSRMIGNKVYLISNHTIGEAPQKGKPLSFTPGVCSATERSVIDAADICIMKESAAVNYVVISSYDINGAKRIANCAVLGSGTDVYMNAENLYIAGWRNEQQSGSVYREGNYEVTPYQETCYTDLLRFSLEGDKIYPAASGTVEGIPDSQFAMDEKDGFLRIVTTKNRSSYKVYEDKSRGWSQWEPEVSKTEAALYILDSSLKPVGSLENLAQGETVYSVRFAGDIGYFVTFRQVDPLFAVDLSDPRHPKVLSSLKIPGFSEYLHPYEEGRLFGLGVNANAENGAAEGLKLSMFDVSDPADVKELHTLNLQAEYSEANYNHKAIFISGEKDLIAFPTEDSYQVYGYQEDKGFYKKGSFAFNSWEEARGLYVGQWIYICGQEQVCVVNMDTLQPAKTIFFGEK